MSHRDELIAALDKFHAEYMHGCPVVESTLPSSFDPRNALILKLYRFARHELGWSPKGR